jgi:hypothetical protein
MSFLMPMAFNIKSPTCSLISESTTQKIFLLHWFTRKEKKQTAKYTTENSKIETDDAVKYIKQIIREIQLNALITLKSFSQIIE